MYVIQSKKSDLEIVKEMPDMLCYILCGPKYMNDGPGGFIDESGFLKPHDVWIDKHSVPGKNLVFPLVHPEDCETSARLRAFGNAIGGGEFGLAWIDTDGIDELYNRSHPFLKHGGYRAELFKSSILGVSEYMWKETSRMPNVPDEILDKYWFKFKPSINFEPTPKEQIRIVVMPPPGRN